MFEGTVIRVTLQYDKEFISLLLRRLVFREASAKRVTGDEPQETMGRVQSPVVFFPPSFARTFSSKERRLGTRQVLLWVIIESVCIDSRGILSTPACDVHVRLKTNGTAN